MANHSNVQFSEVIEQYRDKNGTLHKTHVDDVGFYVVIKLRDDIEKAKEISRGIRKGTLRSFSIGGQALSKRKMSTKELGEYNEIDKLELHEVTICEKGINPEAKFDILKEEKDTMSDRLEKTLVEINELMKQVDSLQKEKMSDADDMKEAGEYMDTQAEEDMKEAMAGKDEEKEAMSMEKDEDLDSEKKGRSGPEGFVEAGLMGEESQGKKLPQAPQVGPLYKEWTNEEFSTLDLTTENVEKAYEAFKAEQLEKMAYDSLKKQFESRFVDETSARQSAVAKSEYDAKNEVETLREEFATLRKSLIERNDEIVKSQTIAVPEINVAEMSWGEVHNFMAQYEGGN